jgi:DUF438 domain-containing protein
MGDEIMQLDLKGLKMTERHREIFSNWKELKENGILRIINDHDPRPLQYMLKAESKDNFTWEYKKEGPDEWIIEIKKLSSKDQLSPGQKQKREELKQMLKRLHEARPEELDKVKKEAQVYFKDTDPKELALAEQELIQEGTTRQEMKRLCDVHLEVMKEQLGKEANKIKLPAAHPISILKDEHKIIKRNLKKLKRTFEKLNVLTSFVKAKRQINTLKELSHFFLETEKHHQREEEAIFPRLVAHGITEPPEIFKEDHVEFKAKKRSLNEMAMHVDNKSFPEFLDAVGPIIEFLTKNLEEHIYKEDNILYPMAYQTLEKNEWKEVRKKFDAIGYCCFAPADLNKKKQANNLRRKQQRWKNT